MVIKRGDTFYIPELVLRHLVRRVHSERKLHRTLVATSNGVFEKATQSEMHVLKQMQHVKLNASELVNIVTVMHAKRALEALGGFNSFAKSLRLIHISKNGKQHVGNMFPSNSAKDDEIEFPTDANPSAVLASMETILTQLKNVDKYPQSLPHMVVPKEYSTKRIPLSYVAPDVHNSKLFKDDMACYEEWVTAEINLARKGMRLSKRTFVDERKRINQFLGFLYVFCEVAVPGLLCYLNVWSFSKFISYIMAKRNTNKRYLDHHIRTAERVCMFLGSNARYGGAEIKDAHKKVSTFPISSFDALCFAHQQHVFTLTKWFIDQ